CLRAFCPVLGAWWRQFFAFRLTRRSVQHRQREPHFHDSQFVADWAPEISAISHKALFMAADKKIRLVDNSVPVGNDDVAKRQEELELAHERLRRCKALVDKIVQDFRHDATLSAVLRKAILERERRQDECDVLVRELSRMKPADR